MFRIVRVAVLAVLCVALAVVPVALIIFWPAIRSTPSRRGSGTPQVGQRPPAPTPAPAPVVLPEPPPPRKGNKSWAEVEEAFAAMQVGRTEHPEWVHDLSATYGIVANPAYTDSFELLDHCTKLSQWRRELPNSPTALVATARAHIDWAWEARGPWVASMVKKEDWEKFYSRLAEARRLLDQAIEMGPKDGEAYRLMILVAMGEGWPVEEARATLDEGRKVDPTYFPMYVQFARFLLPRWHGKRGDLERFANEVPQLLPGDDGLEALARIASRIHLTDSERELLFLGEYDKALLVKASEVLRQRTGGPNETEFAALCAWVAQDREAGVRLKPLLGQQAENNRIWPWAKHRDDFLYWCRNEEFAASDGARWFWGSVFDDHDLLFATDSRAVWCGGGYGPSAVNCLEIDQGRIISSLPGSGGGVSSLAVDESRRWVVAGIQGDFLSGVALWDLRDPDHPRMLDKGKECRAIAIHPSEHRIAVALLPIDRRRAFAAAECTVQLLNPFTDERGASFEISPNLKGLRFSADGTLLIVSSEHETIRDAATGELQREMPHIRMQPRPEVECKKVLDVDAEGYIWALLEKIKPPRKAMLAKYAPDGKNWDAALELGESLWLPDRAILSADRRLLALIDIPPTKRLPHLEIAVWDIASGKKLKHFAGHFSHIEAMRFSPDGKWLASIGFPTGLVKLWPITDEPAP